MLAIPLALLLFSVLSFTAFSFKAGVGKSDCTPTFDGVTFMG